MSETKPQSTFIVVHETVLQSWLRDASSFAVFAGLVGLGVAVGSSAMQWAGFFVAVLILFARATGKTKRLTREEAIEFLSSSKAKQVEKDQ